MGKNKSNNSSDKPPKKTPPTPPPPTCEHRWTSEVTSCPACEQGLSDD